MSLAKTEAIRLIESLPDDCTAEDIQYHLYVRDKVRRGLDAIERGDVASHEQVKQMVRQWPGSSGPIPR